MRINRYIAQAGICSRRGADRLIEQGRVTINGHNAVAGAKVQDGDVITIDGIVVTLPHENDRVYIAFNKPVGITCTSDLRRKDNIISYINYPKRIYTVGRLDRDSSGLILLTDDGDLAYRLTRTEHGHEKEYRVSVDKRITSSFIEGMQKGVPILDTITLPCRVWQTGEKEFRIVLTQGLNRQIRRMCEYFQYTVNDLERTRIMHIALGAQPVGSWRELTPKETQELLRLIGIRR
ncbi:MAG: pseudouridine synthase [Clostridiaceae bacterium]|jgi:23S rRNA pseudouridine2604 synthase|nr:pseudouridine synthase [Clostridia bacterium]MBP6950313.1 pseudouridine synthase [Clostridia bacterium]NMA35377.1 pseudouridine synthase [Clostridiaceae bacterium]